MNVPARFAVPEGAGFRCRLCPNSCFIAPGKTGRCLGRSNVDGRLVAVNYGEVVTLEVDPIEKKPLYHFYPGSAVLSTATYGCNLLCPFCQNFEISQRAAPTRFVAPRVLLDRALREATPSVAFTYTEPLVWFEYLADALPLLRREGIKTILVTNGMVEPQPLAELLPFVDAMNIDLKSIRREFYRDYIKGDLDAVLATIKTARRACHVELTTLLIPGRNDSPEELDELTGFVAGLGRDTVLHFSRYFPRHRATESSTPVDTLVRAARAAGARLDYVYLGNVVAGDEFRDTFCPGCGHRLVDRRHYTGVVVGVVDGKCRNCGRRADLVL